MELLALTHVADVGICVLCKEHTLPRLEKGQTPLEYLAAHHISAQIKGTPHIEWPFCIVVITVTGDLPSGYVWHEYKEMRNRHISDAVAPFLPDFREETPLTCTSSTSY